jgi:hypothetical protein
MVCVGARQKEKIKRCYVNKPHIHISPFVRKSILLSRYDAFPGIFHKQYAISRIPVHVTICAIQPLSIKEVT